MLTDLLIIFLVLVGFASLGASPILAGVAVLAAFLLARRYGFAEDGGLEALIFLGFPAACLIVGWQELL